MTYFNPANIHFSYPLCRGWKLAGEISTRHFLVRKSKTARHHYSLETFCHHDIWLPALHMAGYKNLCTSSRGKPCYPLLRNLSLRVSFSLPLPLSLQTKSSNWVLWGPKLPWALCCGCLIGSVIHKQTTVYCTVLVVAASENCLSTFPGE